MGEGVVTRTRVGETVPLPRLLVMTVRPWLLWKFGMSFRRSSPVGVLAVAATAPAAKSDITSATATFLLRVASDTLARRPVLDSGY